MRSLKKLVGCGKSGKTYVMENGFKVKSGKWYKINIDHRSNYFWLVKFHSVNDGMFNHMENAYVVYPESMRSYSTCGNLYYPLCDVVDIVNIELVSLDYVRGFGINC